jgi:hypothetical protein
MTVKKPILVVMVWRGGERFTRCLESIAESTHFFSRVVLSIAADVNSADYKRTQDFCIKHANVEVICANEELPTMAHQDFWVTYLEKSGVAPQDWVYWLAYDDQVYTPGMTMLFGENSLQLTLEADTVYFGPWAMRHEQPEQLWSGNPLEPMETWTSFPKQGPTKLPLITWIGDQLKQPTYMQMSGSLIPFRNYLELRDGTPKKTGPMRIEMATAAGTKTKYVHELPQPITVIYGRSNSDRANYGKQARKEDSHLMRWLVRYAKANPTQWENVITLISQQAIALTKRKATKSPAPREEWRVRGTTR